MVNELTIMVAVGALVALFGIKLAVGKYREFREAKLQINQINREFDEKEIKAKQ